MLVPRHCERDIQRNTNYTECPDGCGERKLKIAERIEIAEVFAELIKAGFVKNLVETAGEGVAGSCWQLASIPQRLLPFPLLPHAHRHDPILAPKHFWVKMFWDIG